MIKAVQMVVPAISDDEVSAGLRCLTRELVARGLEPSMGLLGGEDGYGVAFENDTFMMHPYCWCEREDCPWCAGCECPNSAFHYYVDGVEVDYERWMGFFDEMTGGLDFKKRKTPRQHDEWRRAADAANARRSTSHDAVCRVCRGEWGNAPHFHHKPSGFKVRWYKYIGRGMELEGACDWPVALVECIHSLEPHSS